MTASIAACWSGVSSNGKPAANGSYIARSTSQREPGAGLAPGLDFQQFGGDVADFFRGLALGLGPLLAAERMQRRGFRRGAGVAVDQVQLRDRHVQAVALGVFDLEVFGGHAAGIEHDQAAIATDAVVLVHDRRAFGQLAEVADDRVGFAAGALAATRLRGALREQLALGEDRAASPASSSAKPSSSGATAMAKRSSPARKARQLDERAWLQRGGLQHFRAAPRAGRRYPRRPARVRDSSPGTATAHRQPRGPSPRSARSAPSARRAVAPARAWHRRCRARRCADAG